MEGEYPQEGGVNSLQRFLGRGQRGGGAPQQGGFEGKPKPYLERETPREEGKGLKVV